MDKDPNVRRVGEARLRPGSGITLSSVPVGELRQSRYSPPVRRVDLLCSSSGEHLSQLMSGFAMLATSGIIDVRLHRAPDYSPGVGGTVLRAEIDGHRVVYDTRDASDFPTDDLAWATTFFKRSFEPGAVNASGRAEIIRPLGLNYSVYAPEDWRLRRMAWSLAGLRRKNARDVVTRIARLSSIGSHFTNTGRASALARLYEEDPSRPGWSIFFLVRTWDPRRVQGEQAEVRAHMNRTRTETIRLLREEFGPRFVGGLSASPDALRDYPDIIAHPHLVQKPAYLEAKRSAAVCIASRGLADSNGWSLAECVAASRAIVTEPLAHQVPGEFSAGRNYLEFSNPDSLLEAVHSLLDDDDKRAAMRTANHHYYTENLRPDAIVARTLEQLDSPDRLEHG